MPDGLASSCSRLQGPFRSHSMTTAIRLIVLSDMWQRIIKVALMSPLPSLGSSSNLAYRWGITDEVQASFSFTKTPPETFSSSIESSQVPPE